MANTVMIEIEFLDGTKDVTEAKPRVVRRKDLDMLELHTTEGKKYYNLSFVKSIKEVI